MILQTRRRSTGACRKRPSSATARSDKHSRQPPCSGITKVEKNCRHDSNTKVSGVRLPRIFFLRGCPGRGDFLLMVHIHLCHPGPGPALSRLDFARPDERLIFRVRSKTGSSAGPDSNTGPDSVSGMRRRGGRSPPGGSNSHSGS